MCKCILTLYKRLPKCSPEYLNYFFISTSSAWELQLSPLLVHAVLRCFYFSCFNRSVVSSPIVSVCISVMINDSEHFFNVLISYSYMCFGEVSTQICCLFINWVICFLIEFFLKTGVSYITKCILYIYMHRYKIKT